MRFPERYRVRTGPFGSVFGQSGVFLVKWEAGVRLQCIADDGKTTGWEHVSVLGRAVKDSVTTDFTPLWSQMVYVKGLFFEDEDTVIEYHPPKSLYVNAHEHVLHLWRPLEIQIPTPPIELVGPLYHPANNNPQRGR